ncbi:hypothetical protein BcepSauron_073 [Burkholderia phage BcepSauron]|uniref:Uncharacterized protein n=2 Tax=Sarumanvirus TaxID=2843450 RepID=A0A482MMR9_9CAUD|nr:hypothetical protein H1O16_gp073 [Burkholderia phage BcepSaruman]YP_009904451.1 hypothetical protein H1O17_gp073 [Burkholderia phage BcepSauron]QBQ74453.1 hypothetical protein BcepSauron_073 [Burkholderia phage BcepSauron]QBX06486.1 hypothetical protein BcepSaruman_073 [Burkholderia phage BcepSaruman]
MMHKLFEFMVVIDGTETRESVDARSRTSAFNRLFRLLNERGALFKLNSVHLLENV